MKGLSGKTALVTGATGLIGSSITRRLIAEGASVIAASRQLEKVKNWIAYEMADVERSITPLELDLRVEESIRNAFEAMEEGIGRPRILIANASLRDGVNVSFEKITHNEFRGLLDTDIAGHFLCARSMIDLLQPFETASIVLMSSIYAVGGVDHSIYPQGMPATPVHYATIKAGILGLTKYLAALWGKRGVRVNAVVSGGVLSKSLQSEEFLNNYAKKVMLGRMATPDEIASAVTFLLSQPLLFR